MDMETLEGEIRLILNPKLTARPIRRAWFRAHGETAVAKLLDEVERLRLGQETP